MKPFNRPSELFRYCLASTSTGNRKYSYEACFSQYMKKIQQDSYLWRSYDRRLQPLIDQLEINPSLRVLEIGCGFGHDLIYTALAGAQAVGIDVNSDFVEISKKTQISVEQHVGYKVKTSIRRVNLMDMEDEVFDFIYMKDVFHHLEPRHEIVQKISSLLATDGQILIIEPNAWNPLIQLQMFKIRGLNTIVEKTDKETGERYLFGNERLVTGKRLEYLFKQVGIYGTARNIRLLPTKFSDLKPITNIADWLERKGCEEWVRPLCVHSIYHGIKEVNR